MALSKFSIVLLSVAFTILTSVQAQTNPAAAARGDLGKGGEAIVVLQPSTLQEKSSHSFQSNATGAPGFVRGDKYLLPTQPGDDSFAPVKQQALQARVESGGNIGFVKTNGTYFTLNGMIKYFSGSNDYFLILRCSPPQLCRTDDERCPSEQSQRLSYSQAGTATV